MAMSEASVSTWKVLVGSRWTNTGAVRKATLRASKALCVADVQRNGVSFLVRMIRGCMIEEKPFINQEIIVLFSTE